MNPSASYNVQQLSLYPLVLTESHQALFSVSVPTLLSISHGIEDAVMQHRLRGTFFAGFQRVSAFLPQRNRFARLAALVGEVFIFAIPDAPMPAIPGVKLITLTPEAPLAQEWFIVFTHPTFAAGLFTRQTQEEDSTAIAFGRQRFYQGALSFNPTLIQTAEVALWQALGLAGAVPDIPKTEPPGAYLTFFRTFSRDLEQNNRELAALYNTLRERNAAVERLQAEIQRLLSRTAWQETTQRLEQPQATARSETLTILTTDIQGFTTLSETMAAAPLVEDLNRYLDMLASTVYQEGGDVDKFLGDGMLALFHDPRAAVRAGITLQRRVEAFNEQQLAARRPAFPTRLAITTGPCLVARVGSRARQEITILGDTVNTASRLQTLAPVGWVLVDEATAAACHYPPQLIAISLKVRGKRLPQTGYQLSPEHFHALEHLLQEQDGYSPLVDSA
jgi:class 3 adenylate cyclase